jgi:hypothetical protein
MTSSAAASESAISTPAPWRAVEISHDYHDGTSSYWQVEYTTDDGATVVVGDWLTKDLALLIAAAPELLEALQSLLGMRDVGALYSQRMGKCLAAVAKATGTAVRTDERTGGPQRG